MQERRRRSGPRGGGGRGRCARLVEELVECAPGAADDGRDAGGAQRGGGVRGDRSGVRIGDGEDCEIDVLRGAEPDHLVGRRVGSEVVDLPVGIAQGDGGHRRRQGVLIAADRGDGHDTPPPPARVAGELGQDAFGDRRCTVLRPDR